MTMLLAFFLGSLFGAAALFAVAVVVDRRADRGLDEFCGEIK